VKRLTTVLIAHGREAAHCRLLPAIKSKKSNQRQIAAFCFNGQGLSDLPRMLEMPYKLD